MSLSSANSIYTSLKNHWITSVMILEFVAIVIYISNYGFEYVTGNFMIMIAFGLLFVLFQLKNYEITPVKAIKPKSGWVDNQTTTSKQHLKGYLKLSLVHLLSRILI